MIQTINDVYQRVRAQVSRVIMGQEKNIDMLSTMMDWNIEAHL